MKFLIPTPTRVLKGMGEEAADFETFFSWKLARGPPRGGTYVLSTISRAFQDILPRRGLVDLLPFYVSIFESIAFLFY